MRTEEEVLAFAEKTKDAVVRKCKLCGGWGCEVCNAKGDELVYAYLGCVPRDFWHVTPEDVTYNKDVFEKFILAYCAKFKEAWRHGFGLLMLGDNGVGKTMFISYVLMEAIRCEATVYYTTVPQLDYDIKRGFRDKELEKRLDYLLSADIVALDELGKEHFAKEDSFIRSQVERILKQRYDEGDATLVASNVAHEQIETVYGTSIASMFIGKYQTVMFGAKDFRKEAAKKRKAIMEGKGGKA